MTYQTICDKVREIIEERTREILTDMQENDYAEAIAESLMAQEDMQDLVNSAVFNNIQDNVNDSIDVEEIVSDTVDYELDSLI